MADSSIEVTKMAATGYEPPAMEAMADASARTVSERIQ
jgi:hypothetical protein